MIPVSLLKAYGGFEVTDIESVPGSGGVYLFCSDDSIEYIGQSESLKRRVEKSHAYYDPQRHPRIFVVLCDDRRRFAIERELIKVFNPPLNVSLKKSTEQLTPREKIVLVLRGEKCSKLMGKS